MSFDGCAVPSYETAAPQFCWSFGPVTSTCSRSPLAKLTAGVAIETEVSATVGPVMLALAEPRNEPAVGRSARRTHVLGLGVGLGACRASDRLDGVGQLEGGDVR